MQIIVRGVLALSFSALLMAQPPVFDVATVRVNTEAASGNRGVTRDAVISSPGSLIMKGVTLSTALMWAYSMKDFQVFGPGWITTDRYDLAAKAAGAATDDQMKVMLQALLAERFKLDVRHENKDLPIYAMVPVKTGIKFHESPADSIMGTQMNASKIVFTKQTLPQLADSVNRLGKQVAMDRPVVDATGLTGTYDFTLDLSSAFAAAGGDEQKALQQTPLDFWFSLFQNQLGLRLEGRKAIVDTVTVLTGNKVPLEN